MWDFSLVAKEYSYVYPEVYLNIASEGVPPMRVRNAIIDYVNTCYPVDGPKSAKPIGKKAEKVKDLFSQLIHGEGRDSIALVKNTTEGISILANGYPFSAEDNIIISQIEHPSCLFPWINLSERKGVKLKVIPKEIKEITPEEIFARADSHTKAVVISAVQYSNGYFADLKVIGQWCREKGIIFAVDAIQALGRMKVDVQECAIDYLSAGGHKGLLGISGMGFVYCSPRLLQQITPTYVGMQSTVMRGHTEILDDLSHIQWLHTAERFESGVTNFMALHVLHESLSLITELGIENIEDYIRSLEKKFRELLTPYKAYTNCFAEESRHSGIVCVELPVKDETAVQNILKEKRIAATVRNGYIRFGIGMHNTERDMAVAAEAVGEIFALAKG